MYVVATEKLWNCSSLKINLISLWDIQLKFIRSILILLNCHHPQVLQVPHMSLLSIVCLRGTCLWADSLTAREQWKKKAKEKEREVLRVGRWWGVSIVGKKIPFLERQKNGERVGGLKAVMSCWEHEMISQGRERSEEVQCKAAQTEHANSVISKRAWEQQRAWREWDMSEMENENW